MIVERPEVGKPYAFMTGEFFFVGIADSVGEVVYWEVLFRSDDGVNWEQETRADISVKVADTEFHDDPTDDELDLDVAHLPGEVKFS